MVLLLHAPVTELLSRCSVHPKEKRHTRLRITSQPISSRVQMQVVKPFVCSHVIDMRSFERPSQQDLLQNMTSCKHHCRMTGRNCLPKHSLRQADPSHSRFCHLKLEMKPCEMMKVLKFFESRARGKHFREMCNSRQLSEHTAKCLELTGHRIRADSFQKHSQPRARGQNACAHVFCKFK